MIAQSSRDGQSFGLMLSLLWLCFHPYLTGGRMATIEDRLCPAFSGQVGPVVFRNGVGQSDDPDALAYFHADADRYDVTDDYDHDPLDDVDPDVLDDPED